MSEPKWTKGPWRRLKADEYPEDWGIESPGDVSWFVIGADQQPDEPIAFVINWRAHADLIAAAPELYRALADAKVTLEEAAKILAGSYPSLANNIVNQCAIRCGDALAKARGDSQ